MLRRAWGGSEGLIQVWGSGWRGQLGLGAKASKVNPRHLFRSCAVLPIPLRCPEAGAVWGRNCSGQLGLGDTHDRHWPTPLLPPMQEEQAKHDGEWGEGVGVGSWHTVVSWAGRVYATGRGHRGQTGLGHVDDVCRLTEIPELRGMGVRMVACGEDFTIAATEERMWGFGNGSKLGQADGTHTDRPRPVPILGIAPCIRKVVCGWGHSLVLTDRGVLAWGWNLHGQCGLGHKEFVPVPRHVEALAGLDLVDITVGSTHSLALTSTGTVLVWGSFADGKLGVGDGAAERQRGDLTIPHRLASFDGLRVVQLAAGADHTAAITEDGGVYLWGFGQHGSLGFAEGMNEAAPRRLTSLPGPVEAASCGMDITVVRLRRDAQTGLKQPSQGED